MANNSVSSLRIPAGFKVEAFDSGDLTGTPLFVSGDTPSLAVRAFDNRISSVRISALRPERIQRDASDRELHEGNPGKVGHCG